MSDHDSQSDLAGSALPCPACGQPVAPDAAVAGNPNLLQCPACGEQFFAAEDSAIDPSDADEQARRELEERHRSRLDEEKHAAATQELSDRRIRLIAMERRALYRSRSWGVILAGVCAVASAQLLIFVLADLRRQNARAVTGLYTIGIPLLLLGVWFFAKKAADFHALAKRTHLTEPDHAPDFSPLSDGSQHVKNLEAMGDDADRST